MRPLRRPPIRRTAAAKLRGWANQLEPPAVVRVRPTAAPLVRMGGRWWSRDELVGGG